MAETSALGSSLLTISRSFRQFSPSLSSNIHHQPFSFFIPPLISSRFFRLTAKASSDDPFDFDYGSYPWDPQSIDSNSGIQWVREDTITMFTADGLIQLGGSLVPRRISPLEKRQGKVRVPPRYQRFQESDYMDPNQSLCLGALFDIAATNGLDTGRRLCIVSFCRSIEMLSDVVEDSVLEQGGEVVVAEKGTKGGLQEKLSMTVAVPLLWGVPPASDTLHLAVRSGGGIVQKVFWQWHYM
ncbi:uncharacterized protein LOC110710094 [Chenopodium quinoa]|uniref:DUF7811 domain-containing protein n=1 Tax=Chenopodium quinoa TaxID=63459 RepID=A0A803NDY4_CHEQI|nr:uncharacterized protein LOC110709925 isoform X2 [Chenopodium quinoa]XP_021744053.1 uncharacterized protein LOC110710094 [Chenopodium quinoa]